MRTIFLLTVATCFTMTCSSPIHANVPSHFLPFQRQTMLKNDRKRREKVSMIWEKRREAIMEDLAKQLSKVIHIPFRIQERSSGDIPIGMVMISFRKILQPSSRRSIVSRVYSDALQGTTTEVYYVDTTDLAYRRRLEQHVDMKGINIHLSATPVMARSVARAFRDTALSSIAWKQTYQPAWESYEIGELSGQFYIRVGTKPGAAETI